MTTLTMHDLASKNAKNPVQPRSKFRLPSTPKRGMLIDITMGRVVVEDDEGKPRTPMTKIRFNERSSKWEQVSSKDVGMLVFFRSQPSDDCRSMVIVQVVPNGRACYVEPA